MKPFDWDLQKNALLKIDRLVCFEDVLTAIDEGNMLDNTAHHNPVKYKNQRIFVVQILGYVYLVPYVEDEQKIFLKTIIPSRKATRKYLKGENL